MTPQQTAFSMIEAAAMKGARCPQANEFPEGGVASAVYALADQGKIKIETYAKNWRVVQILEGPHAGKRTKACPHNHDGPWRVIDQNGTHHPHQDARWAAREAQHRKEA